MAVKPRLSFNDSPNVLTRFVGPVVQHHAFHLPQILGDVGKCDAWKIQDLFYINSKTKGISIRVPGPWWPWLKSNAKLTMLLNGEQRTLREISDDISTRSHGLSIRTGRNALFVFSNSFNAGGEKCSARKHTGDSMIWNKPRTFR
jgi:hypothetical protein